MTTPPPRRDGLRIGGLIRCCIETVRALYPQGGPMQVATEGQQLRCRYHPDNRNHRMIFRDGAWEWDRAAAGLPPDDAANNANS